MNPLEKLLESGQPILLDGAMGTMLMEAGLMEPTGQLFEPMGTLTFEQANGFHPSVVHDQDDAGRGAFPEWTGDQRTTASVPGCRFQSFCASL